MAEPLPFPSSVHDVTVGDLSLRLAMIDSLDDAIEYYVETAPDDSDRVPYYTVLWDSAKALAGYMAARPRLWPGRHVLELGCGLGLPSLVAAALGARVTATDYHPDNEAFLLENARLCGVDDAIRYLRMDWRRPQLDENFDAVLGSDLIYDKDMIEPMVSCVRRLCAAGGTFYFADPGREHLQRACTALEEAGFEQTLETDGDIYLFEFRYARPAPPGP